MRSIRCSQVSLLLLLGIALLALAIVSPPLAAAGPPILFEAPFLSLATAASPAAFELADMNNDGTTDIIVSSGSSLGFISGHGDGTFGPLQDFSSGSYWVALAVGDLNEDGFPDIAALSDQPTADIFLGDGNGSFSLFDRVPYPNEGWPSSIAVADMDQDGHPDLVTTHSSPAIDILPGHGDGTFGPIRSVPSSGYAHQATVGDLDRNGIPDMVVTRLNLRSFFVYLGTGGGEFANPIDLPAGFGPAGVAIGDLNGDSNPDIAVANGGWYCGGVPTAITRDSTITVYLGDGAGHFSTAPSILTGHDPWSVSLADMDSDGVLDLVVGHDRWRGGICWLATAPMEGSPVPRKTAAEPVAPASIAKPGLSVFGGRGDGTFDPEPLDTWSDIGFLSAPADLNRDGREDIVAVYSYHASLALAIANEDGSRGGGSELVTGAMPRRLIVHDFDHEGLADVVTNSYDAGTVEVFEGRSDRHLGPAVTSSAGKHPAFLATGDLDHDAIDDIAVADFGVVDSFTLASVEEGAVLPLRGGTGGSFTPFGAPVAVGNFVVVRIGDMNEDGHADIVAGAFAPPTVSILLGRGDGTFATSFTRSYEGRTFLAAALGDFNADGHLDVAMTASLAGLRVLYGRGDGTLLEPVALTSRSYSSLESVDLDANGQSDLVASEFTLLDTYLSNEDGTFRRQTYFESTQARAISLDDVNGDAVPDLAEAGFYGGVASVSIGTGGGLFTGRLDYAAGGFPTGIDVGDIDGDGRPDLAVANSEDHNVSIRWGTSANAGHHEARAFLPDGQVAVSAASDGPPIVVHLEPVAGSYRTEDVVFKSLTLHAHGTGSTESIRARFEGVVTACCDQDHNGVPELPVPFAAEDVARLFDRVEGTRAVPVDLTGVLASGQSFHASLSMKVMGATPALQAYLVHMPSRGSTLYVTTASFGRLSVRLYDIQGRLARTILNEPFASAGMHTVVLDGPGSGALASGVYFYRVESTAGGKSGQIVILH